MTAARSGAPAPEGHPGPKLTASRERFERLYCTVRDRICLLEYAPGERLSEEELAAEFKVSRTPIRRVLSRLEAEGLVESRHGVGTLVIDLNTYALTQVYQLRMELAVLIGRLDPLPRSDSDMARLREVLERCDELARQPRPGQKALARLNIEFYQEIRKMIGNQPLREISDRLYHLTARIWLNSVPRLNLRDEIEIFRREIADVIAALEIGDLESVGYIRRSHIAMSFARLQRYGAAAPAAPGDKE